MNTMRLRTLLSLCVAVLAASAQQARADGGVVVIGHSGLERMDPATVQRIYTGRVVELGGVAVKPINVSAGSPTRQRFLQVFLNQDDENYIAYWTVRRYIGKGVPPKEVANASEVIRYVQSTPGAIGYIDESSVTPGLNILLR
jgi:ABC-type phosphate transport system substrate-binding protein